MPIRAVLTVAALLVGLVHHGGAAGLRQSSSRAKATNPLTFTYFGAAGWEITDGKLVVLVDPYVSRNAYPSLPDDVLHPDGRVLDALVPRADYILVHHSHPDHFADVPYLAARTGATVVGTRAAIAVLRAYGVPARQLVTAVGGEDMAFDGVAIRAIPALHTGRGSNPTTIPDTVTAPVKIWSLEQGGSESLMFLIRLAGHEILTMGSTNFIEREVEGLRPDIAVVGASTARRAVYDYTPRLLRALGKPGVILPTHWDNFYLPYGHPDLASGLPNLETFADEVHAVAPQANVVIPEHLVSITIGKGGKVVRRERVKPRVEEGLVPILQPGSGFLSRFDAGEMDATSGLGWAMFADSIYRGKSAARLRVARGGAEGSSGSLVVSGEIPNAPNPYAGAIFWPGNKPWGPVDLSGFRDLSFWAKGDGRTYRVEISAMDLGVSGVSQTFEAGRTWQQHTLPLSSFGTDGRYVTAIAFLAGDEGPFWFQIDQVRLVPR